MEKKNRNIYTRVGGACILYAFDNISRKGANICVRVW